LKLALLSGNIIGIFDIIGLVISISEMQKFKGING
jgi:hypothetical protein